MNSPSQVALRREYSRLPLRSRPLISYLPPRLRSQYKVPVLHEVAYLDIVEGYLGREKDPDLEHEMGLWRADVAMRVLQKIGTVEGYLGAMVCDRGTTGKKLVQSLISELENGLGKKPQKGVIQKSVYGNWEWCFASVRV